MIAMGGQDMAKGFDIRFRPHYVSDRMYTSSGRRVRHGSVAGWITQDTFWLFRPQTYTKTRKPYVAKIVVRNHEPVEVFRLELVGEVTELVPRILLYLEAPRVLQNVVGGYLKRMAAA